MNIALVLNDLASSFHIEIFQPVSDFIVTATSYSTGQERYVGEASTIEGALEDLLAILASEE